MRKVSMMFLVIMTFFSICCVSGSSASGTAECGGKAQVLIDSGKYSEAIDLLEKGIQEHPGSDWLLSMLGRAYYKEGNLEAAEAEFRKALEINKDNIVAKKLIKEMRNTQDLLRDRDLSEWVAIGKEKAADLLTTVLGVWIGMLLSSISSGFYSHFTRKSFRRALAKKDFDYATDILEDLVVKREKAQLRKRLKELLNVFSLEDSRELIIDYVDDPDVEKKLVHFLSQIYKKSSRKGA